MQEFWRSVAFRLSRGMGTVEKSHEAALKVSAGQEPGGLTSEPQPAWSMPPSFGYKLRRLQLAYNRQFQQQNDGLLVSSNQIGALSLICRNPDLTPTDLSTLLMVEGAQVTAIVKQLEVRGLVRRTKSTVDSRSCHLRATVDGEKEFERLKVAVAAFEAEFVGKVLTEAEIVQLHMMLDRLEAAARASTDHDHCKPRPAHRPDE